MTNQNPIPKSDPTLAELFAGWLPKLVETSVAEGIRRGKLPEYLRTSAASRETGLKARSLKHLRDTGQISFHKQGGTILYRTKDLLDELDQLQIPRKTRPAPATISGITQPA